MSKNFYKIGIFLNSILFFSVFSILIARIFSENSPIKNYFFYLAGFLIIFLALANIIYGLIFVAKSSLQNFQKFFCGAILLAGIFPPLYFIFPIFQFTLFRKMLKK